MRQLIYKTDGYLIRLLSSGFSITHFFRGDVKLCREIGKDSLDYGFSNNEPRCQSVGHRTVAMSYLMAGDFPTAIENAQSAVLSCSEPFFYYSAKLVLGVAYIADGHDEQAKNIFDEIIKFDEKVGTKYLGAAARLYLGFITIRKGELRKGINMVEEMIGFYLSRENQPRLAIAKHLLARVYLLMLQGSGSKSFSFIAKNIYFLVRTLPLAARKAEQYLAESIRISKMIGAKVVLAQAVMDFGVSL